MYFAEGLYQSDLEEYIGDNRKLLQVQSIKWIVSSVYFTKCIISGQTSYAARVSGKCAFKWIYG